MIIRCNSCEKKFVVPDQAVTSEGRVVQCGSCGNKWRQFPIKKETSKNIDTKKNAKRPLINKKKPIKKRKRIREINLYSPEYLAKKHGINLDTNTNSLKSKVSSNKEMSFGFYAYLIVVIIFLIFFLKLLYFFQDKFISLFPFTEIYISTLFEVINNSFQFWRDLVSYY